MWKNMYCTLIEVTFLAYIFKWTFNFLFGSGSCRPSGIDMCTFVWTLLVIKFMNCVLSINYRHGDSAQPRGYVWHFNVELLGSESSKFWRGVGCTVWAVRIAQYVVERRLASIFVLVQQKWRPSEWRQSAALKVGTCVARCTASFSRTLESSSAPLGETETSFLRPVSKTAKSVH
jgi:hypothetical protein